MPNIRHSHTTFIILLPNIGVSVAIWKQFAQKPTSAFTFDIDDSSAHQSKAVIAFLTIQSLDDKNIWKYALYFTWFDGGTDGILACIAFRNPVFQQLLRGVGKSFWPATKVSGPYRH